MFRVAIQQAAQASPSAAKAVAAVLLAGAAQLAVAADAPRIPAAQDYPVVVAAAEIPRPALEVSASTLPRFDGNPGVARSSRVDITLLPERRSGIGLAMGMSNTREYGPNAFPSVPSTFGSVDLGVHWRYTLDSNYRFDVTAYRRMPSDAISLVESREATYGARVEMGLASRYNERRGFVADRGFVGLQLDGGARLTVKRSRGVPMLYYRNNF